MNTREIITIAPLIVITLVVGFYPQSILHFQQMAVEGMARLF
jgi:NADH:ubiquinone oxidoreductase subunit 4 (subunit M)